MDWQLIIYFNYNYNLLTINKEAKIRSLMIGKYYDSQRNHFYNNTLKENDYRDYSCKWEFEKVGSFMYDIKRLKILLATI